MARLGYAFLLSTIALGGKYLNGQTPTQMVEPGAIVQIADIMAPT
jgi:hypothetical protein